MRDNRGFQIKKILGKQYPAGKFKVKIDKYAGGEAIHIYTNLLKDLYHSMAVWRVEVNHADATDADREEYFKYREQLEKNRETEEKLKALLDGFESVDRDDNGETLLGGNTYLFVECLK